MRKTEETIQISKEEKSIAIEKLKEYIQLNFDEEIGNLQTEIFFDYITKNIGIYYYNKAIGDAFSLMTEKTEDLYLLIKD